jgi:hypothetical protein
LRKKLWDVDKPREDEVGEKERGKMYQSSIPSDTFLDCGKASQRRKQEHRQFILKSCIAFIENINVIFLQKLTISGSDIPLWVSNADWGY